MRDRRGERSRRLCRYCVAADSIRTGDRGQLSLTVIEAIATTLFVLAVAAGFALTSPASAAESNALARQTTDTTSLVGSVPAEESGTLLDVACESPAESDDRTARLHEVATTGLLNGAFVSLRAEVGPVGRSPPETARMRTATAMVPRCTATLEV